MARQTRAERRARRQAAEPQVAADGAGASDRGGKPPVRLAPEPPGPPHHRGNFIRESIGELRKVEWPGQNQVIQGTVVVLIACAIIGSYLYLADQVFRRFVENVLLGQ
jgi:preprotein translocase SecE subunit